MPIDIAEKLRLCADAVPEFTPASLAVAFGMSAKHFHASGDGPIVFLQGSDTSELGHLLQGTIFWPSNRPIIRGVPRALSTSDHATERYAIELDSLFAQASYAAIEGNSVGAECFIEPNLFGTTIRVYSHNGDLYCATDVAHDAGNPIVGAGIDNTRILGIDFGSQAARILSSRYGRIERLANLGYVGVFVLQLPEFAPDGSIDRSDMILLDVIDPDHVFVDRLEKERIAEDFNLNVVELSGRMTLSSADPMAFVRRCRALEHQAAQEGKPGFVVKARLNESSDQMCCRIEPSGERDRIRDISPGDITAVTEEITAQFGDLTWHDDLTAEGLMLDFLGSRHRSVQWKVQAYLSAWRDAQRVIAAAKRPTAEDS